jgi:outer membrane receptor protein involved in Fe transport
MEAEDIAINRDGYLNAAVRWTFVERLHIEMDFNNLLFDEDKVDYFNRELKIIYIEYF